jgi:Caspase domain
MAKKSTATKSKARRKSAGTRSTASVEQKITVEELGRKIADPKIPEQNLSKYFLPDEQRSGAFDPALKLNPETVAVPPTPAGRARGDMLLASVNDLARLRRRGAFEAKIAGGYTGPIVVSEGDSWFQFPFLLQDIIDHLSADYAIRSLDAAGDTLQNMFNVAEYLDAVRDTNASVFLFSGGGNDVLGGGNLKEHLRDFDPSLAPADHVLPSFRQLLDHAVALYDRILRSVEALPGDILIICHGYDRALPKGGKWLGKPMSERGIKDSAFQAAIVGSMIDRFNARLKLLTDTFANAKYLDLRGVVGAKASRWHDELHPTSAAFGEVAAKFKAEIDKSAKSRSLTSTAAARRAARHRGLEPVPTPPTPSRVKPRGRRGLSLHVGLNKIDPKHYGSDAPLAACEFDAEDMANVARSAGFDVAGQLLTKQATRKAVMDGISEAAKKLQPGDIFLFTYSGHGSQIPDFNSDEGEDGADETFCLFDGMMIDDELYDLWTEFKDDVRVLVLSDSCHSGTNIRFAPGRIVTDGEEVRTRRLPDPIAGRTFRRHRDFYTKLGKTKRKIDEGRLIRELATPLRCTVMLISGCQDNQESADGTVNGRFTQALLSVWNDGQFDGNYKSFHTRIRRGMPPNQTPNLWTVGRPNPAFLGQKPFSV